MTLIQEIQSMQGDLQTPARLIDSISGSVSDSFHSFWGRVYVIFLLPFMLLILIGIGVLAWVPTFLHLRKMRKRRTFFQQQLSLISYPEAQELRAYLLQKTHTPPYVVQGSVARIINLLALGLPERFSRIQETEKQYLSLVEKTLFVDMRKSAPLTEEEQKIMQELGEIWGDDEDGAYSELTHEMLKKGE